MCRRASRGSIIAGADARRRNGNSPTRSQSTYPRSWRGAQQSRHRARRPDQRRSIESPARAGGPDRAPDRLPDHPAGLDGATNLLGDDIHSAVKQAEKDLDDTVAGAFAISLPDDPLDASPAASSGPVQTVGGNPREATRDSLRGL